MDTSWVSSTSSRSSAWPSLKVCQGWRNASWTGSSLMKVPLVEFGSRTSTVLPETMSSQWKLETVGSCTRKSFVGFRPILMSPFAEVEGFHRGSYLSAQTFPWPRDPPDGARLVGVPGSVDTILAWLGLRGRGTVPGVWVRLYRVRQDWRLAPCGGRAVGCFTFAPGIRPPQVASASRLGAPVRLSWVKILFRAFRNKGPEENRQDSAGLGKIV